MHITFLIIGLASVLCACLNHATRKRTTVRVTLAVSRYRRMRTSSTVVKCSLRHNYFFCESGKGPLRVRKATREPTQLLTLLRLWLMMMTKYV
uniref:Secreted peptide n=1 Tax=Rhipicephalus pulchellus TaxID=72859 RepID=L7LVJ2_RHIPC